MHHSLHLCLSSTLLLLVACGPQPPKPETKSSAQSTAAVSQAATSHSIDATDSMRFSKTLIEVPAGKRVTITLNHTGHMPKAQMAHNLIILDRGRKPESFMVEASFAKDNDYIPIQYADWILAHTKLLGPGETDTITFTTPKIPGDYVFLCSFPGHYTVGMKGIMRVVVPE